MIDSQFPINTTNDVIRLAEQCIIIKWLFNSKYDIHINGNALWCHPRAEAMRLDGALLKIIDYNKNGNK